MTHRVLYEKHPLPRLAPPQIANFAEIDRVMSPLGATPALVVYPADLNDTDKIADDFGDPLRVPNPNAASQNYTDPPTERAIKASARYAERHNLIWILDIEQTKSINLHGVPNTRDNRRKAIGHLTQCVTWAREVLGDEHEVYLYCYPQFSPARDPSKGYDPDLSLAAQEQALCAMLSGSCSDAYNYGSSAKQGDEWYGGVRQSEDWQAKHYPYMRDRRHIWFVQPYFAMEGEVIMSEAIWRRQLEFLNGDRFVWLGLGDATRVTRHLEIAAAER